MRVLVDSNILARHSQPDHVLHHFAVEAAKAIESRACVLNLPIPDPLCYYQPMSLTLHLSAELEEKLRDQAKAEGKPPEDLALEALEEKLSVETATAAILPPDEWIAAFDAWVTSHKPRNPNVDDRRESIYPDRS